ncbi:MAG: alpha/beta fold hydrolase [Lachnospiraceae bacterium]|nr:alpha/beta fold hydrolase [Lachnospiraceae bacterium]
MKTKNKLITAILLSTGAAAGTALINKYIKMTATAKNLLEEPRSLCYKWRLGNIHYTKTGSGKPLLFIHDLDYVSNGTEWETLIPYLKDQYTIYTIDLLGFGCSEKPNLTYTNFLYVQLINDFVKSEIGRRTNVIASGSSSSIITMACAYNPDLFEQLMFINPENFSSCAQIPGKYAKIYKLILDAPIIGTLLYHIASSRENIEQQFRQRYFYNPYSVKPLYIDKYYESAHLGQSPKAVYSSVLCQYTKCNISRSLEKINNSIYILGGETEPGIRETIREYTLCNPAVESSVIPSTKHLPQMEKPEEVSSFVKMFFN